MQYDARCIQCQNSSDTFPVKNGLKQGDALTPILINFASAYAIRGVKTNEEGLKLNGTHQLPVYADEVNVLRGSMRTVKKNTEALLVANENGLDVNAEKTKCMVTSRDHVHVSRTEYRAKSQPTYTGCFTTLGHNCRR